MIPPGKAEFLRFGVMHRNTYINSPALLLPSYESKKRPGLFFAGQLTGVEGYVESTASGLVAGFNAARRALGKEPLAFPVETGHGALARYITSAEPSHFQPMNISFGLLPPLEQKIRHKKERYRAIAQRALASLELFIKHLD